MKTIQIAKNDNVAVVTEGELRGHKIALQNISAGEKVIKYGYPIGTATQDIPVGAHVHSHNLHTALDASSAYEYHPEIPKVNRRESRTFMGFKRQNGKVGVRNELWILPTVGCISKTAELIACKANSLYSFSRAKGCGGVYAFPHPYGCSQLGDDHNNTQKLLLSLMQNPNAGAVLILGLGCENNRIETLKPLLADVDYDLTRVAFLECQAVEDELEAAMAIVDELVQRLQQDRRTPQPTSKLVLGMKCGGSDGLSGLTANPLVGRVTDTVIEEGGSAVLTEVPEMFGAEQVLLNRCATAEVYGKAVDMLTGFKDYYTENHQPCYENPSPGNKDGGITTLEEKSLGCVCKSGRLPVVDVLEYAETVKTPGLTLLTGPGNDLVASTALAAAGAQIILFTTGRGTPFGCPVPTVKIATNTPLAEKKASWIDFNAGTLLTGDDMDGLAEKLYDYLLSLASGDLLTKNEQNDYRQIAIFKTGVTL
ncbi:MAG: altronate dehydratase [Clostridia bacterium]|nr:altronate dehydratase [Clostridia bacterium]